jgi:hypothetical protein
MWLALLTCTSVPFCGRIFYCYLVSVIVALVCFTTYFGLYIYGGLGCVTQPMPVPSPDKSGGCTSYQILGININAMAFYSVVLMCIL